MNIMTKQHYLLKILIQNTCRSQQHQQRQRQLFSRVISSSSLSSQLPLSNSTTATTTTTTTTMDKNISSCATGNISYLTYSRTSLMPQWQRTFSTTATAAPPTTTSTTNKEDKDSNNKDSKKKKEDDSNIFLDNLGKIFLTAIATIVLLLIRSSRGTTHRNNLRDDVETLSKLDPLEIDDLRIANNEFTTEVFEKVCKEVFEEFGSGCKEVRYEEFISVVLRVMRRLKGEAFTIELGHLVDRVVIGAMEEEEEEEMEEGFAADVADATNDNGGDGTELEGGGKKVSLTLLLTALSLALNSTVRERVSILYQIMQQQQQQQLTHEHNSSSSDKVSEKYIIEMIQSLQKTCQLVPDSQIIESSTKYPVQEYKVGSAAELYRKARTGEGEKKKEGIVPYRDEENKMVEEEEFYALLRTRWICAWGECYVKKKRGASDEPIRK